MCTYVSPLAPAQGRLVSRFGWRRGIQPPHLPTFHAGIDISIMGAPVGTVPVYCVAAGTVELVGHQETQRGPLDGYGNCIAVRHNTTAGPQWSFYAHQDHLAADWRQGQQLEVGTILGFVGRTNNGKFPNMGPHLHFEIRRAAAGGRSPYPGPYRTYNLDPIVWLAERGVTFARRGVITLAPPLSCDPSTLNDPRLAVR